ncbi:MAG: hypothetical protein KZQ62_01065 [Candidatus Thiodiazotropha sp. (ex Lucinoma aequizonata)]|nr:hypothetical protein [Candidatus Thiodiazotropha sp. (ex Lucinoma aequizonata)]
MYQSIQTHVRSSWYALIQASSKRDGISLGYLYSAAVTRYLIDFPSGEPSHVALSAVFEAPYHGADRKKISVTVFQKVYKQVVELAKTHGTTNSAVVFTAIKRYLVVPEMTRIELSKKK